MIVEIQKIPPEGTRLEGEEPATILDLNHDDLVRIEGPIRCDFFVQVVSHELVVNGSVKAPLSVRCSRCTEFVSTTVADSSFLRAYELTGGVETVDLTGDIREEILLNLPAYPVCSSSCKGLCPRCGKNLNAGPCDCPPDNSGGAWSALDGLKLD